MAPSNFVKLLAKFMHVAPTEVATVDRALAKEGLRNLSKGRHRPDVSLEEGLRILCAWACAKRLTNAPDVWRRLRLNVALTELVPEDDECFQRIFGMRPEHVEAPDLMTLLKRAAGHLAQGHFPQDEFWLTISKSGSVTIQYLNGSMLQKVLFEDRILDPTVKARPFPPKPTYVQTNVIISGAVLSWIYTATTAEDT